MKIKKLPIFLEITKNSFFIILFILIIYTISQLIAFSIFTNEHEINLINDRYQKLMNILGFIHKIKYIMNLHQKYRIMLNLTIHMIIPKLNLDF